MFHCLKCGSALDSRFVSGGMASTCSRCELEYLSVALLMKRSDRTMVREFWEYVLSCEWPEGLPCPYCQRPLSRIPLIHEGQRDPVLGCKHCYHLVLRKSTMSHFEKESTEGKTRERALRMKEAMKPYAFEKILNQVENAATSRWVIRFGKEHGKEYVFAATLGCLLLSVGTLCFLGMTGNRLFWGLLSAVCAFCIGLRFSRRRAVNARADLPLVRSSDRPVLNSKIRRAA